MFVLVLNVLFRVTFKSSYKTSDNSLFIILSWGEKKTKNTAVTSGTASVLWKLLKVPFQK